MSTATAFKHIRPFPFCPGSFSMAGLDSVDIPLADAMAIFWNLEVLSFATTCTKGTANVNWTTAFGPAESLPFTPNSTDTSDGSYYIGGYPATAPRERVCNSTGSYFFYPISRIANYNNPGGTSNEWVILQLLIGSSATDGYVKVAYSFLFYMRNGTDFVIIRNPNSSSIFGTITGTPPSSGTFSILGLTLNWVGGGVNGPSSPSWRTELATISATSSAFTY